jgi:hypothetical protein
MPPIGSQPSTVQHAFEGTALSHLTTTAGRKRAGAPPSDLSDFNYRWPVSELYVSERHQLVYCPIQKVACSSLKIWWATLTEGTSRQLTGEAYGGDFAIDHSAINARHKLHYQLPRLGFEPVTSPDWFRVVFVRNPWSRLVSAYVNKFVPLLDDVCQDVFQAAHRRWGGPVAQLNTWACLHRRAFPQVERERLRATVWPWIAGPRGWRKAFTFRHFVEYIAAQHGNEEQLDLHWRPQYLFLGNVKFDFVGRFERLGDDLRRVSKKLGVAVELPAVNRSSYGSRHDCTGIVADWPLRRLRKLPSAPNYRYFYTPRLRALVGEIYRRDVKEFGYEF